MIYDVKASNKQKRKLEIKKWKENMKNKICLFTKSKKTNWKLRNENKIWKIKFVFLPNQTRQIGKLRNYQNRNIEIAKIQIRRSKEDLKPKLNINKEILNTKSWRSPIVYTKCTTYNMHNMQTYICLYYIV